MDLFELLFIALFILFPVIEGILKRRRKSQQGPEMETDEADAGWSDAGEEPRSAADMVPEELWEVMTGERRPPQAGGGEEAERSGAPWSVDPREAEPSRPEPSPPEPSRSGADTAGEAPEDWRSEPWVVDDEVEDREPVSAEYEGPEAYSLETPAPEPLERKVPSPEARHRAFHELIDRPESKRKRRTSPLIRALRSPDGLRQAVLLREVLGPPKGLE